MVEVLLRLSILLLVIVLLALLANRVFGADQSTTGVPDCDDTAATKPQATKPVEAPVTANDPQPLVLLVTAKWCPVCHDVEGVLSKMRAAGELDGFYTMKVDYDENRKLAEAVMQGSGSTGIPQLVIYRPIKRLIGRVDRTQIGKQLSGVAKAGGTAVSVTPSTIVPIPTTAPAPVFSSPRHPILDAAAQAHANFQAARQLQGHQGFQERFVAFTREIGQAEYAEICNESWPEQAGASYDELWAGAVSDWRQSPGHWSVASRVHAAAGFGLQRGRNGVWYSCIDVKD
jgi:glutaredoxin